MPAVSEIRYGSIATASTLIIQPPVGEVWQLQRFDKGTPAGNALLSVQTRGTASQITVTQRPDLMAGPVWYDNQNSFGSVNTDTVQWSYAAYFTKYLDTDVPIKIAQANVPAGGFIEVRPPVGTDYMMKAACTAFNVTTIDWNIKNATLTSGAQAIASGVDGVGPAYKYGAATTVLLTNSVWGQFKSRDAAIRPVTYTYAELAAGSLSAVSGIANVAANGVLDARAPVGEVWTIGAWAGTATTKLSPFDGVTAVTQALTDSWPPLNANTPSGNAKWVQLKVGTTGGVVAWAGWKHPLA